MSWQRKHSELRQGVTLLNVDLTDKSKLLRNADKNTQEGGAGAVEAYKELSKQAKAVAALIDKELPALEKLYDPVAELFAKYQEAVKNYETFMAQWKGKLPERDFADRAYELAIQSVDKALR